VITWQSSITDLYRSKPPNSVVLLQAAGIVSLNDLLWILPKKISKVPAAQPFSLSNQHEIFHGKAMLVDIRSTPGFQARGKRKIFLQNITVTAKDFYSDAIISLKWFNAYPATKKKLELLKEFSFIGELSVFNGAKQMINPKIIESSEALINNEFLIQYPAINTVKGANIQKIINKIPADLWDKIPETLPRKILVKRNFLSLTNSFKTLHGKKTDWEKEDLKLAKFRLIYEEFFYEQLKIFLRRKDHQGIPGIKINITAKEIEFFSQYLPFSLTTDQSKVLTDISNDFNSGKMMMRLIQGDVGCGKTAIALISALLVISKGHQVAMMCPTEALAIQHYEFTKSLLEMKKIKIALLLGSTKTNSKRQTEQALKTGEINFIIGTHSLIQENIAFKMLGLAIIDEQHKFGVQQRASLVHKNPGMHCLIMTATPIPRSLSLTQYGDLNISVIKEMPKGRKGNKTKIVTVENFPKFLSFLKTRLTMGEQAYVVVPAINESETLEMYDIERVKKFFEKSYPQFRVKELHGQLKPDEKQAVFLDFANHEIDILISTSVIEVGINVVNATIIAIMSPERFGLSSLHQLRGRVGRGNKPGFCFLVNDSKISTDSLQRLKVIEKTNDGFLIAEQDLKIRGQGDLFGTTQSGSIHQKRLANIVLHQNQLLMAKEDVEEQIAFNQPEINHLLKKLSKNPQIFTTI